MTDNVIIAPSILSGDFAYMGKSVKDVENWGADWIHCDVMDGVYVPNFTFGMPMIEAINRNTDLPLDVHLMIDKPEKYAERFVKAGADIVTFHPEASECPEKVIDIIRKNGAKAGIVFNPNVDINKYARLFSECDMVVIMTVYAGYGGQKLIPECIERIKTVKEILMNIGSSALIEVDGGITEDNYKSALYAGANVLVAGSSVFKSENPARTIKTLRNVAKE